MAVDPKKSDLHPLGMRIVEKLLDHLDIAESERTTMLEELLGLKYGAVYRRRTGEVPWSIEELAQLGQSCGKPLQSLIDLYYDEGGEPATMLVGGVPISCRVWMTGPSDPTLVGGVVAIQESEEGGMWQVLPRSEVSGRPSFDLSRLIADVDVNAPSAPRVAVVDDAEDSAAVLCSRLRPMHINGTPFRSADALRNALKSASYDAYVVDWLLGTETAEALLLEIRAADPVCPIAVLTGNLKGSGPEADHAARVIFAQRAQYFQKPAAVPMITGYIQATLASKR